VTTAERYVAGAYVVVLVATLAWLVIVSAKLSRLERDVAELVELARERHG